MKKSKSVQGFIIKLSDEDKKIWAEKCPECGGEVEAVGMEGARPRLCVNGHRWIRLSSGSDVMIPPGVVVSGFK